MQVAGLAFLLALLMLPDTAHAYTGPGLGLGAIVAVLAVVFSSFLAVLAIFWYPIKRMLRAKGKEKKKDQTAETGAPLTTISND